MRGRAGEGILPFRPEGPVNQVVPTARVPGQVLPPWGRAPAVGVPVTVPVIIVPVIIVIVVVAVVIVVLRIIVIIIVVIVIVVVVIAVLVVVIVPAVVPVVIDPVGVRWDPPSDPLGQLQGEAGVGRVSAALRKASKPQQEIILDPPRETKGKVTR